MLREKWRNDSFSNEKLDRDLACFGVDNTSYDGWQITRVALHKIERALHVMRFRWPAHGIQPHAPKQRRLDFKTFFPHGLSRLLIIDTSYAGRFASVSHISCLYANNITVDMPRAQFLIQSSFVLSRPEVCSTFLDSWVSERKKWFISI